MNPSKDIEASSLKTFDSSSIGKSNIITMNACDFIFQSYFSMCGSSKDECFDCVRPKMNHVPRRPEGHCAVVSQSLFSVSYRPLCMTIALYWSHRLTPRQSLSRSSRWHETRRQEHLQTRFHCGRLKRRDQLLPGVG